MASIGAYAEKNTVSSPDGKLNVVVEDRDGKLYYSLSLIHILPGDDILIIERMYEGVAMLISQFQRLLVGIIVNARYQTCLLYTSQCESRSPSPSS